VSSGSGASKPSRSYRPAVEALEALRLLSESAQVLPGLAFEFHSLSTGVPVEAPVPFPSDATWDEALGQTTLSDILRTSPVVSDRESIASGLAQLDRYLSRAWYRAGIPVQMHDDCSQAVYVSLLQNLGRDRFDSLVAEIGQVGIRDVLSRETADGPDFFRAIDTVKKRAQRERTFQPLDAVAATAAASDDQDSRDWRGALQEAIDQSLSPREAALIYATLKGETPSEIALQWGVAPKTVSNEKTRAIQKLRDTLLAEIAD